MVVVGQTAVSSQALGLERVRCYLLSREDTFAVEDEVDPLIWYWLGKDDNVTPITVTTWSDSFEREVIYLEVERGEETGKIFSAAQYLFYYYLSTHACYVFPMAGLRELVTKYWQKPRVKMTLRTGDSYIISRGIEVPLADCLDIPRARKVEI